jgi:PAS domain S-box-containing protein
VTTTSKALESVALDMVYSVSTLNCGITVRDAQGVIRYVNDRLQQWLGYSEEELVGQDVTLLTVPELHEAMLEELRLTEQGDARARLMMFRRKDSTTLPVLIIPQIREPGDEHNHYVTIVVDLGTVQTAKSTGNITGDVLRPRLERIALELQSIGLTAGIGGASQVQLEHPDLESLSDREREVLAHLVIGERVPAIAEVLHISPHTVRNHLKSVYRQLGVGSQSELIKFVKGLGEDAPA